ncbi:MAG: chalcone isomerase family protein [Desulfobulbaceae bacterium]|jgi:hypothetical protein|nr:chalcone isomerase family protein [Desulfobulbaceae bacterium]HKJ13826.1 chalcone isomerase family protein [Desulfobulbales bacterium]MDH3775713.1 chalcone isomerase family protein [Desulfobulbaceae bacterium]MDH3781277.1 chalcone isomerase family protein [Desulfobulbaceae bacterium]MDH3866407.1 chalcone isomerase family protein [Desulfobulbaceae bacterium]
MKSPFDGAAAKTLLISAIVVLIFGVQSVAAREIAGVAVPESVTLKNKALVLNGAGIRKKLFMKIYVCALYLTAKRTAASEILADPEAKRIVMSFLYKEVGVERQVEGWNKGFRDNNSGEELKGLQDRINLFNSLFTTVRKGDVIRFDYMPEEGTQVWINDTLNGIVPGEDFFAALLKIWLGPKPAEANLKDALLGNAY